jgi:hypothetical protein
MVPENKTKQNRRCKQINFIGLQNNRHPSQHKEAFADSFQKLYECCQQCVVKDGHYFDDQ